MTTVTAGQVRRYRVRVQELDRPDGPRDATDAAVLDLGVQETGPDGGRWALAQRGVPVTAAGGRPDGLALAWTVRGAPHLYRRTDLRAVRRALRPYSDADAGKRIYDAAKPLRAAAIRPVDALARVATTMRDLVDEPTVKGTVSGALAAALDEPYLRWCRACGATHLYEMPFRLAALHGGLELEPGTSPPVLRRVPRFPGREVGDVERPADEAPDADGALDLVRGVVHLLGPTDPKHVAAYLDAPVADVKARWPADAVPVQVDGAAAWVLAGDLATLEEAAEPVAVDASTVRLLGPFDLFLQARDRHVLVADRGQHRALWPTLGRPGAVLAGGELVGTWRPRARGRRLGIELDPWLRWDARLRGAVAEQHARLAAFRGAEPGPVT